MQNWVRFRGTDDYMENGGELTGAETCTLKKATFYFYRSDGPFKVEWGGLADVV